MIKDRCISVTDLRLNTKKCLTDLTQPKYVFVNNKPIAVIMNIDEYEAGFELPEITELPVNEITPEIADSITKAKKLKKSELVNL
jgi:hypothetical protein